MADDTFDDGDSTGAGLRGKLEAALKENATLRTEVVKTRASELISTNGYKHVTVEDLAGVGLDELPTKAAELEESKAKSTESTVRSLLASKGLEGDALDAAVADLIGPSPDKANTAALDRIRSIGKVPGTAPDKQPDPTLFGPAKIRAAIGASKR